MLMKNKKLIAQKTKWCSIDEAIKLWKW